MGLKRVGHDWATELNWNEQTQGFPSDSDGKESAMWETQVRSLGQADLLEKGMATHSSILAWRIPWREEPGGLQSMGSQRAIQLSDQHFNKLRFIYWKNLFVYKYFLTGLSLHHFVWIYILLSLIFFSSHNNSVPQYGYALLNGILDFITFHSTPI